MEEKKSFRTKLADSLYDWLLDLFAKYHWTVILKTVAITIVVTFLLIAVLKILLT